MVLKPNVGHQVKSETIPHLFGLIIKRVIYLRGKNLQNTILHNRQERILVTGTGVQRESRGLLLLFKEKETMPQWAGISQAIA